MAESKRDKLGKADREAWDAARKIAKMVKKEYKNEDWSRLPWREIRQQLRSTGNVVDTTAVPVTWTNESPQMVKLRAILEEAGFMQEDHLYIWKND